jgi:hypothetical protein
MTRFLNPLARKPKPGYREAVDRIKAETRKRLELSDDVTVSVTELNCREPDCADTETIVAILTKSVPSLATPVSTIARNSIWSSLLEWPACQRNPAAIRRACGLDRSIRQESILCGVLRYGRWLSAKHVNFESSCWDRGLQGAEV